MEIFNAEILSNVEVAPNIFKISLDVPELAANSGAGQFVHVFIDGSLTLRRPFGIAGTHSGKITIFYRKVGGGTDILSKKHVGNTLNILGALGNGFSAPNGKVLLVGGGIGLAPLLFAAQKFNSDVVIAGKSRSEVDFWIKEFNPHVENAFIVTDDGSVGKKGFPTDILPEIPLNYSAIYTCGPEIMMRGVAKFASEHNLLCEVSLERRMACGLGACLSCSINTAHGRKKVCKDGAIFNSNEVFLS